jgi:endonuclease/exonuclease/phosphatase family metal-dependent hydrolase
MANPAATPEKAPRTRPSRWLLPMWWANALAVLLLLITYLAPHVSPLSVWWLSLLALSYPFQLVLHVGFLVWWWFFRRKRMLLSGLSLLLGWAHIGDHVQLVGRDAPTVAVKGDGTKLVAYNVRVFDLYNWSGNKTSRDRMFAFIEREDADILCLQEYFYSAKGKPLSTGQTLVKELGYRAHERFNKRTKQGQQFGIATFSRYPIVDRGHVEFSQHTSNQCIWTDIDLGSDTVRVYNAHLASYHFGGAEHRFLEQLDTDTDGDTLKEGSLRILKLLRRGMRQRASEVERIAAHMHESPHPVVYCGDMNDVPMSYGYGLLRDQLMDAFVESGRGLGGTYIGNLPSFRIDHIMHDGTLESWDFRTHPEAFSDHHPVSCMLGVKE